MENINSYADIPNDDHFYICGDNMISKDQYYNAKLAYLKNDGTVKWYLDIGGTNPSGRPSMDRCMGVSFNEES